MSSLTSSSVREHRPVMLQAAVTMLVTDPQATYVDATYGRGGHARLILQRLAAAGRLIALDRDPDAERDAASIADPRFEFVRMRFSRLGEVLDARSIPAIGGVLMDLGVSSPQLDDPSRGFSFMQDGPLDMRMSKGVGPTAADVVNGASEAELIRIFREFGEERYAPRIARAIVTDRATKPFERTLELAEMISRVARSTERHKHPATRVFQALRIHVNGELDELEAALNAAFERLPPQGRLAVISFHSLEDRIVKQFMRRHASTDPVYAGLPFVPAHAAPKLRLVGKAIQADSEETARNPRARSARLRVAERLIEIAA
jgi:16S rRNA (cytosine1402-N4)-methyltransferase